MLCYHRYIVFIPQPLCNDKIPLFPTTPHSIYFHYRLIFCSVFIVFSPQRYIEIVFESQTFLFLGLNLRFKILFQCKQERECRWPAKIIERVCLQIRIYISANQRSIDFIPQPLYPQDSALLKDTSLYIFPSFFCKLLILQQIFYFYVLVAQLVRAIGL